MVVTGIGYAIVALGVAAIVNDDNVDSGNGVIGDNDYVVRPEP